MHLRLVPFARRVGGAVIAGCVSLAVLGGTASGPANAASAPAPPAVVLHGEGAWSVFEMTTGWHNALAQAPSAIDSRYTAVGSYFGRADFLGKGSDWVLSGVPFTDTELAQAHAKRSDFIDAPVVVASLGMLFQRPVGGPVPGLQTVVVLCDPFDESTWPKDITTQDEAFAKCTQWQKYAGPIKIPWQNLAAMLFSYAKDANGGGADPSLSWSNPDVLAAMGVDNLLSVPPGTGPATVLRSDPDETTQYMQEFVSRFAPKVWAGLQADYPQGFWNPVSETPGRQASASRGQADQQADQFKWPASDPRTGTAPSGGVLAPIPSSLIAEPRATWGTFGAPADFVELLPVLNANGDYVVPTSASITAAAAAGGDQPLYAFDHKVPGAYPFTWIDHLYAPAHGLSIAKTEGLATLIRYIATAGQDVAASVGEGRLPDSLVQKSLEAADALVLSNCVGADRTVVASSDPGPFAPALPALQNIGRMLHCRAVPAPTTTTTTAAPSPPTTAARAASSGSTSGSFSDSASFSGSDSGSVSGVMTPTTIGTTSAPPADTATTIAKTADHKAVLITATGLPIAPTSSSGFDKLGAFLLGVLIYLVGRGPAKRALHRITT